MKKKIHILVCDPISKRGIEILESIPNVLVTEKHGLAEKELVKEVKEADALVVRSGVKITREVVEAGTRIRAIARAGMGYDNIDLDAATARGVVVMNTPGQNAITTAEHTLAMMMSLARNIPQAYLSMRSGAWDRKSFMGAELANKTLGLVGLGNVGREVSLRARALKMEVVAYDPYVSEKVAHEVGAVQVSLDELFERSDFISLHTVLNETTRHLINRKSIAKMRNRVRIINCARGGLVDEEALLDALKSKKVAGVALDVFETEPPKKSDPLLQHERVIFTPHLGASTDEAQEQVAIAAAEQLRSFLVDDVVMNGVNVPSVSRDVLAALSDYIDLGAKLGKFLSQMPMESVEQVVIEYGGEITNHDLRSMTSATLCGFMQGRISESVNFVNAPHLARERGIAVVETKSSESDVYVNWISVTIKNSKTSHRVKGSVFARGQGRIVQVDEFPIEVSPSGHLLVIWNGDKPGVVAGWSAILGRRKINIAQMQIALDSKKKRALTIVNIDTPAPKEALVDLRKVTNIQTVLQMVL